MTKRSWSRIASATAARSLAVVWGELIDQLRHADPAFDGRIVLERELRGPLHAELACKLRLENSMGSLQARERLHAFSFGAEHGDEDARVPEVRRGIHTRDRHEADSGVLELPDRLRQNLTDGLVHATHAICHRGYSSDWTPSSSSPSDSGASPLRLRAASLASFWGTSASQSSSLPPRARRRAPGRTSASRPCPPSLLP